MEILGCQSEDRDSRRNANSWKNQKPMELLRRGMQEQQDNRPQGQSKVVLLRLDQLRRIKDL